MGWLQTTSLRNKLIFITMVTSAVSLLLASSVFVMRDFARLRDEKTAQLEVLARIVGNNVASALLFQDPESASETLESVIADDSVMCAHLFDAEEHAFSEFSRRPSLAHGHRFDVVGREGHHWTMQGLEVIEGIYQANERVGTVMLYSRLDEFWMSLVINVTIVGLAMLGSLLVALVLSRSFQTVISAPILRLVDMMRNVSAARDYSVRATTENGVELNRLVSGFNEMLHEIEARDHELKKHSEGLEEEVEQRTGELTRINHDLMSEISEREKVEEERQVLTTQLMEAAREAGQAEVATGVLHNVGNVLNSINVSATLIHEKLNSPRVEGLQKASELLRDREGDLTGFLDEDPRGKKLPKYLTQLGEQLGIERKEALTELSAMLEGLEHIKTIVSMQQSHAKSVGLIETIAVSKIAESSIAIIQPSLDRHRMAIFREYEEVREVETDKHQAIQILVNLLSNAVNATKGNRQGNRSITIRIRQKDDETASWQVIDNGGGLEPDKLTRIFQYGYTTRVEGHGFGLHSGALAAKQLGGSLNAESDGPGTGAIFTLELPFRGPDQGSSPESD
ncbi:MAG: GHKL domain-containing protein [bacterium]|nr:GHKL domain-containing protein [bacterium]